MLSTIARAAIRRIGAGALRPSTNQVSQRTWQGQRLQIPKNSGFSHISRRSLATATGTRKTSAKPKTKKKAAKKPKKKVAAKRKTKPKKVLTPEEKTKLKVKELKAVALSLPTQKPSTAWMVMVSDSLSGGKLDTKLSAAMSDISARYKALSPSELEQLNHKANQNKAANEAALKQWIHSHTVDQIRLANNARSLLKKLTSKYYAPLHDDRAPKKSSNAQALFTQDRWASGDLKGLAIAEASKLLSREFLQLPERERQEYQARARADRERYAREFRAAYNRDPPNTKKASST